MADDAVASWLEENGHSGSFFFFKQKTAYEIIAGDWSSDVCSSDLTEDGVSFEPVTIQVDGCGVDTRVIVGVVFGEIGRASCRERV